MLGGQSEEQTALSQPAITMSLQMTEAKPLLWPNLLKSAPSSVITLQS